MKVVDNDETKEILNSMEGMEEPEMHIAFVQYNAPFSNDEKISLLQTDNVMERMQNLNSKLSEALRLSAFALRFIRKLPSSSHASNATIFCNSR